MDYTAYLEAWRGLTESKEALGAYTEAVRTRDESIGAVTSIAEDLEPAGITEGSSLRSIPFLAKDNIAVEGQPLSCSSRILEGFESLYSATAVSRLEAAGALCIGKTNLDEFGMGSGTLNSSFGATSNPWDLSRVPGGSSGGSAAAVAAGYVPFALGSDTGGSVRQPANFCGIYGLKPTYGAVSRYGLVAYASSLECIGVLSDSLEITEEVFEVIKGIDPNDQSSRAYPQMADEGGQGLRIRYLEDTGGLDPEVQKAYERAIEMCREAGWETSPVAMRTSDYVVPAYYTIATAEASANLARYTGIRYGYRSASEDIASMMKTSRDQGFGQEVKLRILLGTYVLRSGFQDQYYTRAQRIRTLITDELTTLFSEADLLMMPVFPTQAFRKEGSGLDAFAQKLADRYTVTANLAGVPALSIPTGIEGGLPVGIQFLAAHFSERKLFSAARTLRRFYEPRPAQEPIHSHE